MAQRPIVIAISRLVGAGGAILGQRLATRLNVACLDREILQKAAERAGCAEGEVVSWDERVSRFWDRMVEALSVGPAEGIYSVAPPAPVPRDRELFNLETQVIRDLVSERGAVVVGRGSFYMLRDVPNVLRVFLHAAPEIRAERIMKTFELPNMKAAMEMVRTTDLDRERYIREMTGQTLADARNYDLSIDTGRINFDGAESLILSYLEQASGT